MKLKNHFQLLQPSERLHQCPIPIIGLTGSIATGKSTVASQLRAKGIKTICADDLIHKIYQKEKTFTFIKELCPQSIKNDQIDFPTLRKLFFENKELKDKIEKFLYSQLPLQFTDEIEDTDQVIVYDVPLLYEKGIHERVDVHGVVYSSKENQRKRLLNRDQLYDTLTLEKVINSQMPIDAKKDLAEFVIDNNLDLDHLKNQVDLFISNYLTKD